MNPSVKGIRSTFFLSLVGLLAACEGGFDDATITSTGTITGFGSVFVNGIEFETGSSSFDVDDNPSSSEDDLAIGMVVTVVGGVSPSPFNIPTLYSASCLANALRCS